MIRFSWPRALLFGLTTTFIASWIVPSRWSGDAQFSIAVCIGIVAMCLGGFEHTPPEAP